MQKERVNQRRSGRRIAHASSDFRQQQTGRTDTVRLPEYHVYSKISLVVHFFTLPKDFYVQYSSIQRKLQVKIMLRTRDGAAINSQRRLIH